jgi:hypothetical protein
MKITVKLWLGILLLVVLSPLGLILPEYFKAGSAWGEWGSEEVRSFLGYIPRGLEKLSALWRAPIPDYVFRGCEKKGLFFLSFAYIISAVIGIAVIFIAVSFIGRKLTKKGD